MRALLLTLLFPVAGLAALGDPCPPGQPCPAGEVCLGEGEEAYCTIRCPAGGCPDGYGCVGEGRVRVCVLGADAPFALRLGAGRQGLDELVARFDGRRVSYVAGHSSVFRMQGGNAAAIYRPTRRAAIVLARGGGRRI